MNRVAIVVRDGAVETVASDEPIEYVVLDHDVLENGGDYDDLERAAPTFWSSDYFDGNAVEREVGEYEQKRSGFMFDEGINLPDFA